jgi:predicted alpha-1,2-mannosidase
VAPVQEGAVRSAAVALVLAAALLAAGPVTSTAAHAAERDRRDVDVFVGTGGPPPWFSGNTHPAASRPFGMVQLGPDTTADPAGTPSGGASGYHADDPFLRGFSPLHLSGAGCPAFGDVPILPVLGALPADPGSTTVAMDKETERAGPGRYSVRLANRVRATMAAADRSGLARFAFPPGGRGRLLVKAGASLAGTSASRVRFLGRDEIAVTAVSGGFCDATNSYRVHVVLRFDEPFRRHGTWRGSGGGAWVSFGRDRTVRVQLGVSFVDVRGARRNLDSDPPGWSVRRLAARAAADWDANLDRVRTRGGTAVERRLFDTALYRVFQFPSTVSDADGRYPGFDGKVHRLPEGERQLSSISGWDFYRTHAALLAWIRPDVASQVARSLVRDARQGDSVPRWPLAAAETGVMSGDSAAPALATTYAFGGRDFGLDRAVQLLVRQGDTVRSMNGHEPRPGLADYLSRGFVPDPVLERGRLRSHGASITLEYALDDFAISRLATAAGRKAVAARYLTRSGSWRNLLDPSRDLLVPRDAAGEFPAAGVDVTQGAGFDEGTAVQYTWGGVPHDIGSLLSALGTADEVSARLDTFFTELNAGSGPHAWLGNQPSLGTPWDYYWLGRPARAQDVVTRARTELWFAAPDGLPGNDDLGALSAWYVWASMGLYPVTPGTATLAVGVPAFSRLTVRSSSGSVTRIRRVGTAGHVGGVTLDGTRRTQSWLALVPRRKDRTIIVTTTSASDSAWGTLPGDVPPSYPNR